MSGTMNIVCVMLLCAFGMSVSAERDMTSLIRHIRSMRNTLYPRDIWAPQYSRYTHKRETMDKFCNKFVLESKYLSIGDEFKKVGYVNSDQTCLDACAMETDFYCAAAMLRMGNMCFLSGFKTRDNYYSTQYYKICEEGDNCFISQRGVSLGHSSTQQFPDWVLASPPKVMVAYCEALCKELSTCVGFALREKQKDRCYLTTLDVLPNHNFDLYMRQCEPQ